MHKRTVLLILLVTILSLATVEGPASAQPTVWTEQYGNLRQGYQSHESVLTAGNIATTPPTVAAFSALLVDLAFTPGNTTGTVNEIFAQPLYVPNVSSSLTNCNGGTTCNMLIVATLGGGLYAFNAGDTTHSGGAYAGALIWARNGASQGGTHTTNYFWYDDCNGPSGTAGISSALNGGVSANAPWAGVVATPVVDTGTSPNLIYVTSLCETSNAWDTQSWYVHQVEINDGHDVATPQAITGSVPGSSGADGLQSGICPGGILPPCIPFQSWNVMQRPGLLKVRVPGVSYPLIYMAFGFGAPSEKGTPYQGWVFAYDDTLTQRVIFATATKGGDSTNTDQPACAPCPYNCANLQGGCGTSFSGCIPSSGYIFSPNWCGHATGIWGGSGRAPSANTLSVNGVQVSNAYFGTTNGGFQQWQSDGNTLLPRPYNWSEGILDFTFSSAGTGQFPSQFFIPWGGPNVAVHPPLGTEGGTANPVLYSYQGLNQNDFDMAVSGTLLFDDLSGNHRLVTCDKAGYCYLLTQGNLCGDVVNNPPQCYPGHSGGKPGFMQNDPGDSFAFAANLVQCPDQSNLLLNKDDSCDRITTLALNFNQSGIPQRLYFWPAYEKLTGLQLSDGTTQFSGSPNITWNTGSTTVTFAGACTQGANCFTDQVIPGDTLIACSCTAPNCPIVTTTTDLSITISSAFPGTCAPGQNGQPWSYTGYFVNPIRDNRPVGANVESPGGSVEVTSNSGGGAVIWGVATVCINSSNPCTSSAPTLFAYDVSLNKLWCTSSLPYCDNSSSFVQARFALPTVVNGYIYLPTAGINYTTLPSTCLGGLPGSSSQCCLSSSKQCGGVVVYTGH